MVLGSLGAPDLVPVCAAAASCSFVLVGHSAGALYTRAFAALYPSATAAIVSWDGDTPGRPQGPP